MIGILFTPLQLPVMRIWFRNAAALAAYLELKKAYSRNNCLANFTSSQFENGSILFSTVCIYTVTLEDSQTKEFVEVI